MENFFGGNGKNILYIWGIKTKHHETTKRTLRKN